MGTLAEEAVRMVGFRRDDGGFVSFRFEGFLGLFEWHPAVERWNVMAHLGTPHIYNSGGWFEMSELLLHPNSAFHIEADAVEAARAQIARSGFWEFRGQTLKPRSRKPSEMVPARLRLGAREPSVQFALDGGQALGTRTLSELEAVGGRELALAHGWSLDPGEAARAARLIVETLAARERPIVLRCRGAGESADTRGRLSALAV